MSVDLARAYDRLTLEKAFKVLNERAEFAEETRIVQIVMKMYEDKKWWKTSFFSKTVILQGSLLSCFFINAIRDDTPMKNTLLEEKIGRGDLGVFADDILVIVDSSEDASKIIEALNLLKDYGLELIMTKTKIISDIAGVVGTKIWGIEMTNSFKYSMEISCKLPLNIKNVKKNASISLYTWKARFTQQTKRLGKSHLGIQSELPDILLDSASAI